ncbi:amidohydrolase family protein [Devosia sp. ZB163]|uniref:amidohydrolase family protein n=1 Tax=Devosia sp. ZB163 TaxID=3025938 RepID=UPI00235FC4E4|nr:amidohydrolase family protein [Devosia sp. ZB163]MDC9825280.1 amidohydrolase family protein [Devosia sp. ZB163]
MSRLQIVDPHIHLWDLWTRIYPHFEKPGKGGANAAICRSYLIDEYLEEGGDEFEIVGAVHVEAFPTDPIKETETLQKVADANPLPLVIVGNGDLTSPEFPALLDRHQAFPIFRGIRQVVNMHANPARSYVSRDLMAVPQFLEGLRELGRRGLSFDLQLYPHQMDAAAALAAAAPDTRIILNHTGMWADRDLAGWKQYKAGLRTLAAQPNIVAKVSGLGMLDHGWTTESIRPLVLEAIEAFGPERAMFASNFPVDKLYSDFRTVWRAFDNITAGFSETERAGLFRDNARKFYRIPA